MYIVHAAHVCSVHVQAGRGPKPTFLSLYFFWCVCRLSVWLAGCLACWRANGVVRYRGVPPFLPHSFWKRWHEAMKPILILYVIVLLFTRSFSLYGPDFWAELIFKMSKGNGDVQALLKNRMEGMRVRDEFLCPVTCELFRWVLLAGALTPVLVHHPFHPLPCPAYCCLRSLTLPLWRREGSP